MVFRIYVVVFIGTLTFQTGTYLACRLALLLGLLLVPLTAVLAELLSSLDLFVSTVLLKGKVLHFFFLGFFGSTGSHFGNFLLGVITSDDFGLYLLVIFFFDGRRC